MKRAAWAVLVAILLVAGPAAADQADALALKTFEAARRKPGKVIEHLDLAAPFSTRTPWTFVAVQGPTVKDAFDDNGAPGRIFMCLVHDAEVQCGAPSFPKAGGLGVDAGPMWNTDQPDEYGYLAPHDLSVRVVRLKGSPCLVLTAASLPGINNDRLTSVYVLGYDRKADRFVGLFAGAVGHNNNQAIRVVESGPLAGSILGDDPTPDAPFGYFISVYQPSPDGTYVQRLRYRSRTRYNDGNPLSVIDSEMPEILRRLNLWKAGDPLPTPSEMPQGCKMLELRRGVEWCR